MAFGVSNGSDGASAESNAWPATQQRALGRARELATHGQRLQGIMAHHRMQKTGNLMEEVLQNQSLIFDVKHNMKKIVLIKENNEGGSPIYE